VLGALYRLREHTREKGPHLPMPFVLVPLHKPCEKSLLYPIVRKLLTGQLLMHEAAVCKQGDHHAR